MAEELEFFARCASGFESTLGDELRAMGNRRVRPLKGGVAFFGKLEAGYRACLWSRTATRIQLVLTRIQAHDANSLYNGIVAFPWEEHIAAGATIAVEAHGTNANLRNTTFTALKAKDALCDRLRKVRGTRPNVDAKHPDLSVNIALHQQKATVYLNLSGESLHRRGWREDGVQTEAPLKETLAAGMLLVADWPHIAAEGGWFADPMCGSGTLAIEAALIALRIAPGLFRQRWGFESWAKHDAKLWQRLVGEAKNLRAQVSGRPRIVAGDLDERSIEIAKANARRAGVQDAVQFFVDDAANLGRHLRAARKSEATGLIVTNPPYGIRLMVQESLLGTYAALAKGVSDAGAGWTLALITPDAGIDSSLGRLPDRTIACFNGPIETTVRLYGTDTEPQVHEVVSLLGKQRKVPIAEKGSAQFAARFRKVARERARWAKKQGVDCYCIYDADLPDYALRICCYRTVAGDTYTQMTQLKKSPNSEHERTSRRIADAAALVAATLDIAPEHVILVQNDEEVLSKAPALSRQTIVVREGPYEFALDLGRTSTPLPLSLRLVRELVGTHANGKRVACLFATGAAALVYAQGAKPASAVLVDSSRKHLQAARVMLTRNKLADGVRFIEEPVTSWVRSEKKCRHTYDMIICIPPTWLSAKDAGGHEWDLARDGAGFLRNAASLLTSQGSIIYANNAKAYLSRDELHASGLAIEDFTKHIVPHDFERSSVRPQCLMIRR